MNAIAERIQQEMNKQNRSITNVAKLAEISREGLSKILRGLVTPRRDTLERIAQALNIDVVELLKVSVEEVSMGSLIPGTRPVPAGVGLKGVTLGRERLEILRQALAIICVMELQGDANPRLREDLTHLVSRLEGTQ